MSSHRLEITVSDEVWASLDVARGHEPRASFVKRALESALRPSDFESLRALDVELGGSKPGEAFAGLPESRQPVGGRPPVEQAKRSAPVPRLAARQGKGVFTPRPKGKS